MYIFKTSKETFESVIENQKRAYYHMPREWTPNEFILVSKNKADCVGIEKQIRYIMRLVDIRPLKPGEAKKYWRGIKNKWKYLFECKECAKLNSPFDLKDIIDDEYNKRRVWIKLLPEHEATIGNYLKKIGAI